MKALKAEGYRIVLVNSNPATIMTDPELADATYIEPITPEIVAKIIEKERHVLPGGFALLPTMGGQTALNTALSLRRMGVLENFDVEMIGATADAIDKAEDRELFREAMQRIGLATPKAAFVNTSELKKRFREEHAAKAAEIEAKHPEGRGRAQALSAFEAEWNAGRAAPARRASADRPASGASCRQRDRPAGDHPPLLHACRHRRRHRLHARRALRACARRPRRLAHQRGADRGIGPRLEGIRDGGRPRQGRQLHHRLLDREHRSDGRPYRRFHHRRPGADADRQGIPADARRLDRGVARDRGGDRRLQRAVRGRTPQTGGWW